MLSISCNSNNKKVPDKRTIENRAQKLKSGFTGNYVSEDYFKRSEGYDWMVLTVNMVNKKLAEINIMSRSDIKKPTCTFYSKAVVISKDSLAAEYDGSLIIFAFTDSSVFVNTNSDQNTSILNYFCSGGGSIGGEYIKLKEELDSSQLNNKKYFDKLSLNGIVFTVEATNSGALNNLSVLSEGLKLKELNEFIEIEGNVVNTEIGDLNIDGWPEILIYTTTSSSGSYGDVICYSVNDGRTAAKVDFPELSEDQIRKLGYMGHDEFAIVESTLVRRFPIYRVEDVNAKPTGGTRQIQYKLRGKSESVKFVIDKILDY